MFQINFIINEGGRASFTLLCLSFWAQGLWEELIGKVKEREPTDQLSDQSYLSRPEISTT